MSNVILKDDKEYPSLLKKIGKDAPKQIYYKVKTRCHSRESGNLAKTNKTWIPNQVGNDTERSRNDTMGSGNDKNNTQKFQNASLKHTFPVHLFNNCLAVVGSRRLTHYGEQAIERIVGEIAMARLDSARQAGITIVSGFMYGGDALAHQIAVRVGGRTIAVMPCGIDRISPEDQEELYNDIIENNGMIISEYEGDMTPALWTYPRRNRIVAGLSQAVLVVEAGEKSGSLITANLAKKFGRKIFAVPGPITSSVSKGTNMLIKQGAEMVTDAGDILKYFRGNSLLQKTNFSELSSGATPNSSGATPNSSGVIPNSSGVIPNLIGNPDLDSRFRGNDTEGGNDKDTEKQILAFLGREPLTIDEISRDLEISVSELSVKLSIMEMQGLIEPKQGKYYNIK